MDCVALMLGACEFSYDSGSGLNFMLNVLLCFRI
jgi:hypothetical protein